MHDRVPARAAGATAIVLSVMIAVAGCTASANLSTSSSAPAPVAATGGGGLPAVPGIVKEIEPSVVTITTPIGLGSGVVYHSDGTIVTDAHVVENQQKRPFTTVQVQFADGTQASASVVAVDDVDDVAVVKTTRSNLPAPKFASGVPEVGQMTVVIGSPLGLVETVTAGIVSALHRNMPPSKESPQGLINLIQTDAAISPGNSGGAVVNSAAAVIGLSEAYLPPSSGAVAIGFVTPAATVTEDADQLLKSGKVKHAFLGITPSDISPQVAQRFKLSTTSGALVINVSQGSPAAMAGMQPGDIITKFAGSKIGNVTDLLAALRKKDPGQQVDIVVQRGAGSKTLSVTLGDRANGG